MTNFRSIFGAAAWMAVSALLMATAFEPVDTGAAPALKADPQIASLAVPAPARAL